MRIYLHSELSTSHASHGVSHEDYDQYSAYCTRRLSRLRHGKPVKRELLHCRQYKNSLSTKLDENGKDTLSTSKAKHAYRAIDMNNIPSDVLSTHVNYFMEPLYCAERCWAQSMSVKAIETNGVSSSSDAFGGGGGDPKKDWSPGKIRAHSIKRLRKAVKFATLLESLTISTKTSPSTEDDDLNGGDAMEDELEEKKTQPPVDEHTQMEAKAYASWMRGNLALEQNHWQSACNEYQTALTLCESLASNIGGSTSKVEEGSDDNDGGNDLQQLELFDFFTTRAQNVIAPLLRYCHYELQVCADHVFTFSPPASIHFTSSIF